MEEGFSGGASSGMIDFIPNSQEIFFTPSLASQILSIMMSVNHTYKIAYLTSSTTEIGSLSLSGFSPTFSSDSSGDQIFIQLQGKKLDIVVSIPVENELSVSSGLSAKLSSVSLSRGNHPASYSVLDCFSSASSAVLDPWQRALSRMLNYDR